jgi:hypothetical protein
MDTSSLAGLVRRFASTLVAFCALVGATGAHAFIAVDTLPRDPRAGDYVTLQVSGRFPREDFRVVEALLRRLEPVEPGSRSYLAEVDIYYRWNPLYFSPLAPTDFTAQIPLGVFETSAEVTVVVHYFPARGEEFAIDPDAFETATFNVSGGGDGCGNEMALNVSGACTASLRFGPLRMGERSYAVPVVIYNAGDDVIHFGPFDVNSADYGLANRCGETLEPRTRCEAVVTFSPSLHGNAPGRLAVRWTTQPSAAPYNQTFAMLSGSSSAPPPIEPTSGTRMVEFYSPAIDQYFLAGDEKEIAAIDRSSAWRRTGVTFIGLGEFDVCRFYGDVPAGPNGHLYVARIDECEALKLQDRVTPRGRQVYRYEGVAFTASLAEVASNGGRYLCPAPSRPIYQFRRQALANRDVAYRYVPAGSVGGGPNGDDIARTMLASGWYYDGHAMCSMELVPEAESP